MRCSESYCVNRQQPQFGPGHNKAVVRTAQRLFCITVFQKEGAPFQKAQRLAPTVYQFLSQSSSLCAPYVGDLAAWSLEEEEAERRIFVKGTFGLNTYISSWHGIHPFEGFNRWSKCYRIMVKWPLSCPGIMRGAY